jgi:hypothetical protein
MKVYFPGLYWHLATGLDQALSIDAPITKKQLDSALPIKKGDRVALLYVAGAPALSYPVKGSRLRNLLTSLEKGLRLPIDVNRSNTNVVYQVVGQYFDSKQRIKLIRKFEQGRLTALELTGDYLVFAGSLRRNKDGVWTYALES